MRVQENEVDQGRQLGSDAAGYVEHTAERYVNHECERITRTNEPHIALLSAEGQVFTERRDSLHERLRGMQRPGDPRGTRHRKAYYAAVGTLLILTGFAFTVIGLEPFRLGRIGIVYCLGIALVAPFAIDEFLNVWGSERFLRRVVTIAFIAAITGGALLAVVRGELLAKKLVPADSSIVIDDAPVTPVDPPSSFYARTETPLRVLMILFGLAIELCGGIAVHRTRALRIASEAEYSEVTSELAMVDRRLGELVSDITALRNEPTVFAARFWRDFYRTTVSQVVRSSISRLGLLLCAVCLLLSHQACADDRLDLVVMLDLSASQASKAAGQKTPFERNVDGVAKLLGSLPAGSRITALKITADSIRDPVAILSARLSDDPGYFGERLAQGRNDLVREWRGRVSRLSPSALGTDIVGTLRLASETFTPFADGRKVLVIYSDMRQYTRDLDLEHPEKGVVSMRKILLDQGRIADLSGVTVYVVGANGGGRDLKEWQIVRRFWTTYFEKSGARCASYSILVPSVLAVTDR